MKKGFNRTARYISLLSVFLAVMLFYVVMLAKIKIEGLDGNDENPNTAYTRTVSVSGLRGEIYDRNGVLLVGNNTSYDLLFEYGSIPDTKSELNRSILAVLSAVAEKDSADKLCNNYYPFDGTYPNLTYNEKTAYNDSEEYLGLVRVLEANSLDIKNTSPKEFTEYFVDKYNLFSELYTNEEIDALLRVRYAMERIKFGIYQPYTIAENVGIELVSYVEEANIDGINIKTNSERKYLYPGYASHILGRIGKIQAEDADYYSELGYPMNAYVGTSGCEKAFENYLRGQDGIMEISYDADGNIISKEYTLEPISGSDVYLTIDIELQIAAEDSLRDTVKSLEYSDSGAALALDPNNGEILATASYPTYDITQFSSKKYYNSLLADSANPLFDRALLGEYAPGSIYKIGSSLAALEQYDLSNITSSTLLNCSHVYPYLHQPTCLGWHGDINVIKAIGVSCNCYFYEVGMRMGIDRITTYTSQLGLGVHTGIELPERIGSIAGTAYRESIGGIWSQGDDLSAVIGQSDHTYTPLQIGVFMSSVVNGGNRYSAHLLHSVKSFYTEETQFEYTPNIVESVKMSSNTYSTLISGMKQVILESPSLQNYFDSVPSTVGGKTGTAEVNGKKDYALFSGFAPLDSPEIVSVCVLEQGVNGGNAAIPVSDIFKKYFELKQKE